MFHVIMTPIDAEITHRQAIGEGGIVNGLYSVRFQMLDGIDDG